MNNEKEITVKFELTEEKDKTYFDRAKLFDNGEEYLKYLLELDRRINGTENELIGYEHARDKVRELKEKSVDELNEHIDRILNDIKANIKYVEEGIPDNARLVTINEETGLMFIPEDDTLFTTKLLVNRLIEIRKLIKRKGGE